MREALERGTRPAVKNKTGNTERNKDNPNWCRQSNFEMHDRKKASEQKNASRPFCMERSGFCGGRILSLFERLIDRGDEQFGGVAVVLSVDEAFRRLIHIDLACDGIERGLHERIHGGGGFT